MLKGDLANNLFSESNGSTPIRFGKNQKKKSSEKSNRGRPVTNQEKIMQESFTRRNSAQEFTTWCENATSLDAYLWEKKALKRKLFQDFMDDHCEGDKDFAKQRVKVYFESKVDSNDNDRDDRGNVDSLSVLEDLYDTEKAIEGTRRDLDIVRKKKENSGKLIEN